MGNAFTLSWIDYAIMLIYFAFVIGIGWALKKYMKSATAFLEANRGNQMRTFYTREPAEKWLLQVA